MRGLSASDLAHSKMHTKFSLVISVLGFVLLIKADFCDVVDVFFFSF